MDIGKMGQFVRNWRGCFLIILVAGISHISSVECVAAASEWPLGIPEEYTMAWLNITYRSRNGTLVTEKSQSGRFAKGGKIASVSGVVVHVKSARNGTLNHWACDPITNEVPHEPWIALVKRGMCEYDVKLSHVHAKNAAAMVVYDREETASLETEMKLSLFTIPGVITYKSLGEKIANISDAGIRVEMQITVGEVCSRPYSGINRTSVLFVSISFIVLMVISLAWLVFYYVQRFRYLHAKDRLAQRLCNAAKKALAKIPTRSIKQTDKEVSGEGECCAVCIEFYKAGDMLRTLPCRHEFHKCCVDPWLLEHRTCPMCKMDILKYYGFIFTGSQESILHLDLEDGGLNSSDSRETESPSHDNHIPHHHHTHHHSHHHRQLHHATTQHVESLSGSLSPEESGVAQFSESGETARKASLISLTMVAESDECATATTIPPPTVVDPRGLGVGEECDDEKYESGCHCGKVLHTVTMNESSRQDNEPSVCPPYKETNRPPPLNRTSQSSQHGKQDLSPSGPSPPSGPEGGTSPEGKVSSLSSLSSPSSSDSPEKKSHTIGVEECSVPTTATSHSHVNVLLQEQLPKKSVFVPSSNPTTETE